MHTIRFFISLTLISLHFAGTAQSKSTNQEHPLQIRGSMGLTNNGISIVPTFSLNAPAAIFNFFVTKGNFSFDPDVRLTLDGKKGGMLFWFRYKMVQSKNFSFTAGIHPAYNFAIRNITESGKSWNITQARRFIALEAAPFFQVSPHFGFGPYILRGMGLQKDGPLVTNFIGMNATFSQLSITDKLLFTITPQLYYLYLDKQDGLYFATYSRLWMKNSPFALQSTINKEISSRITGSKNITWNITFAYTFSNSYQKKS